MGYTVLEEFIVNRDDSVVHYREVGSVAELDTKEAAPLLKAGKVAKIEPKKPAVAEKSAAEPSES